MVGGEKMNNNVKTYLQDMIYDIDFSNLPSTWSNLDIKSFSKDKKLWNYQEEAIKNAIKVLYRYYEDFKDYQNGEDESVNLERKRKLFKWYKLNGLDIDLSIKLDENKRLLEDYYPIEENKFSYEHFINRMSFWMATGSGKSLIIVKLIEILRELIDRKEIPEYDILFLTHRDDLIEQFKKHIEEFNQTHDKKIIFRDLREYHKIKIFYNQPTIFYYRSDLIGDIQKEKIIDFRNYYNNGKWYIILDEAHKGDREESKRQHIYSILSKNGFLFNFSATFTDPRDIITCAYEFNLSSFIKEGYGKHICILKQETRVFNDKEDYTGEEKQKMVLKSLILLTYIKKFYHEIRNVDPNLYHKPLMVTLVNSVNTEDADLKMFFRELEKIGKAKINNFEQAKRELLEELKTDLKLEFENTKLKLNLDVLNNITKEDIIKYVYNSESFGEIEIIRSSSNKNELALKLKSSDRPFALIRIGDILTWLKGLDGYEAQERFENESFFRNLNEENSEINILMGSRSFYEGWDSNRPNVMMFINIGVGTDARKFILQAIGRGVRIEPVKNKRKRLIRLNTENIDEKIFDKIKDIVDPIETLFIFATNRNILISVIEELNKQEKVKEKVLSLELNPNVKNKLLLIPVYRPLKRASLIEELDLRQKLELSNEDYDLLERFLQYVQDDRIIMLKYNTDPIKVRLIREKRNIKQVKTTKKSLRNIDLIFKSYFDYLNLEETRLDGFKILEDEIRHFENIKVYLENIEDLKNVIKKTSQYIEPSRVERLKKELMQKLSSGEISLEQYTEEIEKISQQKTSQAEFKDLAIKYITEHYYIPLIMSKDDKIKYIKHIINVKSEVKFIEDLEKYLSKNNKFKEFDWWMFSKMDENLDEVHIPYYNTNINKIARFIPDFVFWLKKGQDYYIVFVDPKGTEYTDAERKIDGFERIFMENGKSKIFQYNDLKVRVKLLYRTDKKEKSTEKYSNYWFEDIDEMFELIKRFD